MVSRSVRWRAGTPRRSDARSRSPDPRRLSIAWGVSARARAAASSIASGRPSRRAHSWATAAALAWVKANDAFAARARSTNKRTDSEREISSTVAVAWGTASRGTSRARSPATLSASRLVVRSRTPGQCRSRKSAAAAHASIRCSQLSSTTKRSLSRRASRSASAGGRPAPPMPSDVATSPRRSSGSVIGASSIQAAPSRKRSAVARMTSAASRVFPLPPAPVSVTSRPVARKIAHHGDLAVASHEGRERLGNPGRARSGLDGWHTRQLHTFVQLMSSDRSSRNRQGCDGSCP